MSTDNRPGKHKSDEARDTLGEFYTENPDLQRDSERGQNEQPRKVRDRASNVGRAESGSVVLTPQDAPREDE